MKTPPPIVNKGIRMLMWALPLFFIGPSLIYNAFQNKENGWHYLVLAIGIVFCLFAMYLAFRGIATMVNGLFERDAHKKD